MLSSNLNFTIPLLTAQGRNGWTVPFNLTYNSQDWRLDSGGTWDLGEDVGYGYGWRLSAGALTPYYIGAWGLDHYVFVDATGAEYRLNHNNNGIWSSIESLYVWYDSNANILHFRDGSFWVMGCTSGGTEPDAGTMYPTVIENTSGNQVLVNYYQGNTLTWTNSSARIQYIQDVRAVQRYGALATYTFLYTTDAVPHLTSVENQIGTSEAYQFAFAPTQALLAPFSGSPYNYSGGLTTLASMTAIGINMEYSFLYDQSGEMTQVTFPYGGYFKYNYGSVTYSSGFTQREVQSRIMSKDGTQASEVTYPFTHESNPSSQPVHQFTTLADPGGMGQKRWVFSQSGANIGLTTSYQGQQLPGPTTMLENDFTWNQDANGNFYIGSTLTTWNPGSSQVQTKTNQTVDVYGNVTQVQKYSFSSLSTPARTYNYSYLNSSAYLGLYIYNRLTSAAVTDGTNNLPLASNTYDYPYLTSVSGSPQEWDSTYANQTIRGQRVCRHHAQRIEHLFLRHHRQRRRDSRRRSRRVGPSAGQGKIQGDAGGLGGPIARRHRVLCGHGLLRRGAIEPAAGRQHDHLPLSRTLRRGRAAVSLLRPRVRGGQDGNRTPGEAEEGRAARAAAAPKAVAPNPAPAKASIRLFEFTDGKSNKFWEISIQGCEVTVRYGRIGSQARPRQRPSPMHRPLKATLRSSLRRKRERGTWRRAGRRARRVATDTYIV